MTSQRGRMLWVWLLAAYLAALALVGFWPTPVDAPAQGPLSRTLAQLQAAGVPHSFDYDTVEATANMLIYVPVGFAVTVGFRSSWWQTVGVGACTSACVELGQLLFLQHRYPSLIDVATNTAGALLGFLLARTFQGRRKGVEAN